MEVINFLMESGVALLMAILMILGGVAKILEEVKEKMSKDHWIYKAIDLLQKVLDFVTANNQHKKK